jgi:hypothetical protein
MSRPGDVTQTPESKSKSGLASVFKSLTGGKPSKSPNTQSPASIPQSLNETSALRNAIYGGPPNHEQLFEQLKAANPLPERLAAAGSLRHAVQDYPLSSVSELKIEFRYLLNKLQVTSVFTEGKDLIDSSRPDEARIVGFELLTACAKHSSSTDPERLAFYRVLTAPANPVDFHLQLASLVELTKDGKDLSGFHYHVFPLLTSWLRQIFTAASAARKHAKQQNRVQKGKAAPLGEETNLEMLFSFIVNVIKFNFNVSNDETTSNLMDAVLNICVHTPVWGDLKACIRVIDAIITYGEIPGSKLADCVKVLCSIHCLVEAVQADAWRTIRNLCKSHNGQTTVRILLDILRSPPPDGATEKQTIREIRGALSVLEKLFAKDGQKLYPLVPLSLLMDSLLRAVTIDNTKVQIDIMRLILSIFNAKDQGVLESVMEEDWSVMFEVAHKCAQRALEASDGRPITGRSRVATPLVKEDMPEQTFANNIAKSLASLVLRIEDLLTKSTADEFFQRNDCIKFFVDIHPYLPDSCAKLVIDHYMEYRFCYPSDMQWQENIKLILSAFFADRSQPSHIRLHALKAITDVFEVVEMMDEHEDAGYIQSLVMAILDGIGDEKDIAILQKIVAFAVAVAVTADQSLFTWVLDSLRGNITSDRLQSPLGSQPGSQHGILGTSRFGSSTVSTHLIQTPSNVVTKGLIQIFMRTMDISATKSLRVFDELLRIAKSHGYETDARVSAMKMLFRLRADWANRVFLTPFTESDALAASLYRTVHTFARRQGTDETHRSSRTDDMMSSPRSTRSGSFTQGQSLGRQLSRTGSGTSKIAQRHQPMWMDPDPDALPEVASNKASPLLVSFVDHEDNENVDTPRSSQVAINISDYLQTIVRLLQDGCDWEVYSYILVHLASQLTNHALFRAAIPQIRALREALCELIKSGTFNEPPPSSGLRKTDVSICLFHILTMVVSYHGYFSKPEEDEIVRTFIQGIGTADRASKCCIHALSICCHELPASTGRALVSILQKMAQIITQSHVAVHILEFLACLSRLPDLYINFREEEYRIVFMMCFRYLQYVRDHPAKGTANRVSYPPNRHSSVSTDTSRSITDNSVLESNAQPNASDDLPQYMYALAYHVIIFWFLSLKLTDRASQVSWIAKYLVPADIPGKEKIDEQAQVTLDFMQRVAYADVGESAADPTFTVDKYGEIVKKRWIVGQSIVTIEQAARGGWAQITKRQPSGTSCYIIREKFTRPPPHQSHVPQEVMRDGRHSDTNVVFPSHLLLQLMASSPQTAEFLRPIPLADDEITKRAISSFDLNSTVDGHKVGIIYIGENQTQEAEILANIMGSSDYTDFLSGIGTLTRLKKAKFNTQGLDREHDSDGEFAFCWRDRVTEIVFHVTTQMPTNLDHDPQCIRKKSHIGNDYVNIIFNNSGLPFRFDTFPSEYSFVYIVITPESRASFVATRLRSQSHAENAFYKVQVLSRSGFPEISPASETKIVSLKALPGFIRLLALNASVFSQVWANREGGEHVSSWRNRLREINRLREKQGPRLSTVSPAAPPSSSGGASHDSRSIRDSITNLRRPSVANFLSNSSEPTSQRSSMLSTPDTEVGPANETDESLIEGLDFSRWA